MKTLPDFRTLSICGIIVSLLMLSSCGRVLHRPALKPDETRMETIQQVLQQNAHQLRTLYASGNILVETPESSFQGTVTVRIKKPDSLYVKLEATLGIDIGVLFADRREFLLYTPMQNTYYTGASRDLNLRRFLPVDPSIDRLIETVSGLCTAQDLTQGIVKVKENELILFGRHNDRYYTFWIDPYKGVVLQSQIRNQDDDLLYLAQYERFKREGKVYLPQTIRIQRPKQNESVTLFYTSVRANKQIPAASFAIRIAGDTQHIQL
jgi:hypothetical protein